jgi:purine-binding chemotaxis protein CheW
MKKYSYLIFGLNKHLYGISTVYVEEICALPELLPILQPSQIIVGTVNLRGYILPVVDLNRCLNYSTQNYSLTDSLVVLRWEELRVGLIVNKIQEVKNIYPKEIITEFPQRQELSELAQQKIIFGIVSQQQDIFILSHPENWFQSTEIQQFLSQTFNSIQLNKDNQYQIEQSFLTQQSIFDTNSNLEERGVFRERANSLKLSLENQNVKNLRPLTVFTLNGDYFSFDLKIVREFTDINQITPIPCCPPHIVGNMNLRGEILTLIDIFSFLNLSSTNIAHATKVIVVEVESIVAGLLVEEVCDVMFLLNPQEIKGMHTIMYSTNNQYIQGGVTYRNKTMSILNLPQIFLAGELIVNETM